MARRYLCGLHIVSVLAAVSLPLPWALPGCLLVALSAWHYLVRDGYARSAPRCLRYSRGGWRLEGRGEGWQEIELRGAQLSRYFVYLKYRGTGGRHRRLALFSDQLAAEDFRRLSVLLRHASSSRL